MIAAPLPYLPRSAKLVGVARAGMHTIESKNAESLITIPLQKLQ